MRTPMAEIVFLGDCFLLAHPVHCVTEKYTTQPLIITNISCLIPVNFSINITERICHRKAVYFFTNIYTKNYWNRTKVVKIYHLWLGGILF